MQVPGAPCCTGLLLGGIRKEARSRLDHSVKKISGRLVGETALQSFIYWDHQKITSLSTRAVRTIRKAVVVTIAMIHPFALR